MIRVFLSFVFCRGNYEDYSPFEALIFNEWLWILFHHFHLNCPLTHFYIIGLDGCCPPFNLKNLFTQKLIKLFQFCSLQGEICTWFSADRGSGPNCSATRCPTRWKVSITANLREIFTANARRSRTYHLQFVTQVSDLNRQKKLKSKLIQLRKIVVFTFSNFLGGWLFHIFLCSHPRSLPV